MLLWWPVLISGVLNRSLSWPLRISLRIHHNRKDNSAFKPSPIWEMPFLLRRNKKAPTFLPGLLGSPLTTGRNFNC